MKKIERNYFGFTEIGGVGEMIYSAVRFPAYAVEENSDGQQVIVPVFSATMPPKGGIDYSLTGQELLASLCTLYQRINDPNSTESIPLAVWKWCTENVYPYNSEELYEFLESEKHAHIKYWETIQHAATFTVDRFLKDLGRLGSTFEFYYALSRAINLDDVEYARGLYYEGRICDGLSCLEKYSRFKSDDFFLKYLKKDKDMLRELLVGMFPDFRMRLQINPRKDIIEYGAEIFSVFDICWYSFARLISQNAPPGDYDNRYVYASNSILTCMACGGYFVRHSGRQQYCMNPNCQAERNRKNRRACYARKKEKP